MGTCYNRILLCGYKDDISRIAKTNFVFDKLRPLPRTLQNQDEKELWCLENWGTMEQPQIYHTQIIENGIALYVEMITVDQPPKQIFEYLHNKYLRLEVHLRYCDPVWQVGRHIYSHNFPSKNIYAIYTTDFDKFLEKVKEEEWASDEELALWYD
jgi:hypothetical protein